MNTLIYTLLEKINKNKEFDKADVYIESLYDFYFNSSPYKEYKLDMTKGQFKSLLTSIYDVLKYKLNKQEFKEVTNHYVKLLVADVVDGNNVDLAWSINHIYYLTVGLNNEKLTEKYKDSVMFIQDKLIKDFSIEEKLNEKINRKIYTGFMKKC